VAIQQGKWKKRKYGSLTNSSILPLFPPSKYRDDVDDKMNIAIINEAGFFYEK